MSAVMLWRFVSAVNEYKEAKLLKLERTEFHTHTHARTHTHTHTQ